MATSVRKREKERGEETEKEGKSEKEERNVTEVYLSQGFTVSACRPHKSFDIVQ